MTNNNDYCTLTPEDVMEELCIGRNAACEHSEYSVAKRAAFFTGIKKRIY